MRIARAPEPDSTSPRMLGSVSARASNAAIAGSSVTSMVSPSSSPAPGSPWRSPAGSSGSPRSVSQRCSESPPRCLPTTITARPSGARRGSQVSRRACSASLPIRMGGLDQISSYVAASGTASAATAREAVGHAERGGVLPGQQQRALVDVDAGDHRVRDGGRDGQADDAVAAAQVEDPPRRGRLGLAQQHGGALVEPAAAVDPRPADQVEPAAPHLAGEGLAPERHRRVRGEVVLLVSHRASGG